jgi:hypothetical protein
VIVDKLPFASPGDPITAARIDAIRARGGEPFGEYQVPLAILALQQGLGRLIRHRRDRGVLAVLDPRLRTKGYGRRFLASIPPAPAPGTDTPRPGCATSDRRRRSRVDCFCFGHSALSGGFRNDPPHLWPAAWHAVTASVVVLGFAVSALRRA